MTVGTSRRDQLAGKAEEFTSIPEVIESYRASYLECGHNLLSVRLSSIVPHEPMHIETIKWKQLAVDVNDTGFEQKITDHWKTCR